MAHHHHIFIWSPYDGKPGERQLIPRVHLGSLQEALNLAYDNRANWRKQYGEGQVIVATVSSYIGLH